MKRKRVARRRTAVLVVAFLVCAMMFGVFVARRYRQSQLPVAVPVPQQQTANRIVTLFFMAPDASGLVREGREIDPCDDQSVCIQAIFQELQNGPVAEAEAPLPEAAPLPTVRVEGARAVVDLAPELVDELPGGSASELATIYSLVNSITVNFPQIRQVQLLVGGEKAQTLKGHIDISEPLVQDLTHERTNEIKTTGPAPGAKGANK